MRNSRSEIIIFRIEMLIRCTFGIAWYVWILGRHKHNYKRIKDGKTYGISWQRHRCTICKKVVGLDDWQIADLPPDMLYEKIQ